MNEKPTIDVNKVPRITKFIYTLGVLPTSYLMSMTYQEQLTWLCNYIQQTLIPAINNDVEAVQELQTLFELLRTYVNDYFDNLDVQEEINNKLDEMVEDGTLEEIISKYIDTKLSVYDSIEAMVNNTKIGEMFKLKNYDTTFITTENETISSLKINDNLYADVISKTASVDSLGITTNIDDELFAEIVEYVRNKGVEIYFLHKTYNLVGTITIPSGNKLKLSGLGYDSVINYTGNDYAFIFNKLQQAELKDFTINCTNQGGGIYVKYATGQERANNLTATRFFRVYIYDSKNPFKCDSHCGYVTFEECQFRVGTTDGIGIDFSGAYYPEFITIERCQIANNYRDTENTGIGIYFNSGIMLNIKNNDIIGHYKGIEIDGSLTTEIAETINILQNSIWDCLSKGIYIHFSGNNRVHGVSIKDTCFRNSQRNDTLDYAIHIVSCSGLAIDSISMMLPTNRQVFLSDCKTGYVKNIDARLSNINQSNNQIGNDINFEYRNNFGTFTVPANESLNVEIGSEYNIVNFHNYILTQRGANNVTTGLTLSNQSITGGKISFTLTNTTNNNININVKGF